MSEEEKQAIECLKWDMLDSEQINIILNLIDKQQKEIEEKEMLIKILRKTKPIEEVFHDLIKEKEYISKDKIREFIKERTKPETYNFKTISVKELQELLEED